LDLRERSALEPDETIPRAIRNVTLRLILFYVLSITVMLSMTPWDRMDSGITGSPFVLAFAKAGVPYAAGIMNLVVITAALSSANTNLYLILDDRAANGAAKIVLLECRRRLRRIDSRNRLAAVRKAGR
jgi:L-asparagine transporter-like permease